MEIWQSDGLWWVNENGREFSFESEQKARLFMIREKALEQELVEKIIGELLPQLRKLYKEMSAIGLEWNENDFQEKLAAAAQVNGKLAGFNVSDWLAWGAAFQFLEQALQTPIEAAGGLTCRQILLKRYTAEE